MEYDDAVRIIENCAGFTDPDCSAAEAWATVQSYIAKLEIAQMKKNIDELKPLQKIKKIIISEITRPSLYVQELKQSDGSFKLGGKYWKAIDFVSNDDMSNVVGKYDQLRLQLNDEVWAFGNTVVMLFNQPNHYVLTYDYCFIPASNETNLMFDHAKEMMTKIEKMNILTVSQLRKEIENSYSNFSDKHRMAVFYIVTDNPICDTLFVDVKI